MKVLILSCDTGEGHNSAAAAVAGALTQRGIESHVFDPLVLAGKYAERFVSGAYTTIMKKAPSAFNALYRAGDIYSSTGITSPVYHANARYAANLRAFIETNGYDRVVCTHLYPMETLTAIRKSGDFTVPCYGVLTDYTCIPFLAETDLDGYFIAHEDLRAELVEKGIPSDRIIVTGIPVDEKFAHHMEKAAARNYLAIPQNQDVFLIMSGGIGVGNAGAICDEILRRHSGAFTVYILVGRNSDLKQTLEEKYAGNEHVRIVTFTKKVNVYMNAADVMISKPGGLTSTEAAVAQVPLVQLLVYTACEAPNIAFFSSHGLSERAENAADAAEKAVALVRDKARAEAMREAKRSSSHLCSDRRGLSARRRDVQPRAAEAFDGQGCVRAARRQKSGRCERVCRVRRADGSFVSRARHAQGVSPRVARGAVSRHAVGLVCARARRAGTRPCRRRI